MTNKPHLEIYTHTHKGISVTVKINYPEAEVSLVENEYPNYPNKKWLFANRTPEYLGSWLNILDAMKSAVSEAKKKLEDYEKEREKEDEEVLENVILKGRKK